MAGSGQGQWPALLGGRTLIFVTVGSMFPFERMIRVMDQWAAGHASEEVVAQIGAGQYEPAHMRWQRIFTPDEYKTIVKSCRLLVAHAGTGSAFTASEFGKPIVLIPRRAAQKEHTTDHQLDTAKWLEDKPGIFVAWTDADVAVQIERAGQAVNDTQFSIPASAPQPFLNRIREFLVT
jgi:UDP-N-acetylglucosamine transferase subunit ALG13